MAVTDSRCQCTEANFFHQQYPAFWQAAPAFLLAASEHFNGTVLCILPRKLIYLGGILISVLPEPYIVCYGFLPINIPVNYLLISFPQRYVLICSKELEHCAKMLFCNSQSPVVRNPRYEHSCSPGQKKLANSLNSPAKLEVKWFQTDPNFKLHLLVSSAEYFTEECFSS